MSGVDTSIGDRDRTRAVALSTLVFVVAFAVWTLYAIVGIELKRTLGFDVSAFGLLVATPFLTGAAGRVVFGIMAERWGARPVMAVALSVAGMAALALPSATGYFEFLLFGLGIGLAGGAFGAGIAYVTKWFPTDGQGSALAVFGTGNVGAAITFLLAPLAMAALGWTLTVQIWGALLIAMAILFWLAARPEPELDKRRAAPEAISIQIEPLTKVQVWRFSLYYAFTFGGFAALAVWMPLYLIEVYDLELETAGALTALCLVLPGALFRAYGSRLADRYGARRIMYWALGVSVACTFLLAYPPADYVIHSARGEIRFTLEMGLMPFLALTAALAYFMSLGAAAVYKHIPVYYPNLIGSVGGFVGMVGSLAGFALPVAFGLLFDLTGVWTTGFMLLFAIVATALIWMHVAIRRMEAAAADTELARLPQLPEMEEIHGPEHVGALGPTLTEWHPEDETFWRTTGRRIAQRNLWISIPCLLLAFAVWMVWSVVIAKLPAIGFDFTTDQLFWLAALPGLSGATLRIFYSFMVPIFGGRLWTALSTASLLFPAFGIGYAVQDPDTPYLIFLVLALLCGLGGGNFASSMANISFFFPKAQKGNALALNAGLGNLGVSVMQFAVPLVITTSVFGALAGEPQAVTEGGRMWLQNAGFIWVPFLAIATVAAWFGMNDIASAKASFAEQAIIFKRKHNWIMCILYTGTFGSFIGYSAGFPLLAKTQFPEVDSLGFVFLGPLVGALSRAATGWISDRFGGGRVTFWVFALMIAAVAGVLFFLGIKDQPGAFWGFFAMFMLLFFATGVGNASTFQMIPIIMRKEVGRLMPELNQAEHLRQSERESAAIIAFTSAIAAYGAFFIPKAYGTSIALTGTPDMALYGFGVFYALCVAITWSNYTRKGGLLHDIERGIQRDIGRGVEEPTASARANS